MELACFVFFLVRAYVYIYVKLAGWEHCNSTQVFVSSTHFDNNSPSQELSASLVMEKLQDKAGMMPMIVMGDFNSQNCSDPSFGPSSHYNNSEAYKILTGIIFSQGVFDEMEEVQMICSLVKKSPPPPSFFPFFFFRFRKHVY